MSQNRQRSTASDRPAPEPALRPVRDVDGASIAALIEACFAEYEGCLFSWDEFPELNAPAQWASARGTRMWVLHAGDALIGCICATPDPAGLELHKFYLAREARGSGLAERLLGEVLDLARARGDAAIVLWTDTRFTRAHRFYEKNGFVRQPGTRLLHDISNSAEYPYRLDLASRP